MLEEGDLGRPVPQGLRRAVGVEGDLHSLPVALVHVVELVEVVEEEVLHDEPGVARLRGDVGVGEGGRLAVSPEPREVLGVAPGTRTVDVQRIPGQVEVVGVVKAGDVGRAGPALIGTSLPLT